MLFSASRLLALGATVFQLMSLTNAINPPSAIVDNDDEIIRVSAKNFAKVIKGHDNILAEFTVPWCPHSKIIFDEVFNAAKELNTKNITTIQIDCEKDDLICSQLKITFYPTFKFFRNQKLSSSREYTGDKSVEGLVEYAVNQAGSAVQTVSSIDELKSFVSSSTEPVVVEFGNPELASAFEYTASTLFGTFSFVKFPMNTSNSGIELYIPQGEEYTKKYIQMGEESQPVVYEGSLDDLKNDKNKLSAWLRYSILPYFADVDIELYRSYMESYLPVGYYFYLGEESFKEYEEFFTELGKKYRGEVNFIGLDAVKFHSHVQFLNMREQFPLFAIHNMTANLKYGLPQMPEEEYNKLKSLQNLDKDEITQLVEDFVSHKATPIVKSEDVPQEQLSNVYKLVATTHDELVHDAHKDVVVRYYAPWDPESTRIAPMYAEIANMFASDNDTAEKFLIAEVDASLNDILSFSVTEYPTIVIYPAGETDPIVYSGPHLRKSIFDFILDNSSNEVDGTALWDRFYPSGSEETVDLGIKTDNEIIENDEL